MPTETECARAQEVIRKCGTAARANAAPSDKCFRRAKGSEVDAGNFNGERLAKAGDETTPAAIETETAKKIPVVPEDKKTPKANLCGGSAGMQLTTYDGAMALRLCAKAGEPGYLKKVASASEAKQVADEFARCKQKSDVVKCARKLGATARG